MPPFGTSPQAYQVSSLDTLVHSDTFRVAFGVAGLLCVALGFGLIKLDQAVNYQKTPGRVLNVRRDTCRITVSGKTEHSTGPMDCAQAYYRVKNDWWFKGGSVEEIVIEDYLYTSPVDGKVHPGEATRYVSDPSAVIPTVGDVVTVLASRGFANRSMIPS